MKENIWRIIFWGVLALICAVLGIVGFLEDSNIRKGDTVILNNIITIFNSSDKIHEYDTVGATVTGKVDGRKIIIEYRGASEKDYIYTYKDGILTTSFTTSDNVANNVLAILTDSIGIYLGEQKDNAYNIFASDSLYDYTIEEGIEVTLKGNITEAKISTTIPVKPRPTAPIGEITYFLVEDFEETDKTNYTLEKTKENLTFIRKNEKEFILSETTFTSDTVESLKNILIYFYGTNYASKINNLNFNEKINYEDDLMLIEFNPTIEENITGDFIKVTIK